MPINCRCILLLIFASAIPLTAQSAGIPGPHSSPLLLTPTHQDSTPHYFPIYQTYARG